MTTPRLSAVGVDVQTNYVVLTHLGSHGGHATVVIEVPRQLRSPGAQRLAWWAQELRHSPELTKLASRRQPSCVVVELPIGRFPKPQSLLVCGVVMAELQRRWPCPVLELSPPKWKSHLDLSGAAPKSELTKKAVELGLDLSPLLEDPYVQDVVDSFLLAKVAYKLAGQRA